jgi:hypothetical protein
VDAYNSSDIFLFDESIVKNFGSVVVDSLEEDFEKGVFYRGMVDWGMEVV